MSEGKPKQVRIYNEIEKEFGFTQRVFAVQVLRPWYGFDVEKRYRQKMGEYSTAWKRAKNEKDDDALKAIEKEQKEFRDAFFSEEKKRNPEMFTIYEMHFSFQHFSNIIASVYNKACSMMFVDIIQGKPVPSPYTLINEIVNSPFTIKKKEYNIASLICGSGFAGFVSGLDRKIRPNFTPYVKDFIIGKRSIPNAASGFPIPVYKHTSNGSLVSFQGVDYENEKLVCGEGDFDDYVIMLRVPVVRPSERVKKGRNKDEPAEDDMNEKINFMDEITSVEFKDVPFIVHSRHILKTARDGSTNALIKDYLNGTIDKRIRHHVAERESDIAEFIKSKGFTKKDKKSGLNETADIGSVIEDGISKWTGISSYEIVKRDTKRQKGAYFFHFTCNVLPKNVTSKSEDRVMGIDFCFSRKKILQCTILDLEEKRKDLATARKWIVDEMPVLESVYHLHGMYAKFYTSMKNLQRSGKKDPRKERSIPFVQQAFENKRKYFIGKLVSDVVKKCVEKNVSVVRVENLSGLRGKDDWFTVHRIRSFPVLGMLDRLESKLNENGISMERVNPKNTSRTCPICGTINDGFTFEYRKTHCFPVFTCANGSCQNSKEPSNGMEYHFRDADLNASINIASRG